MLAVPTIVKRSGTSQKFSKAKNVHFLQSLSRQAPPLTNIDVNTVLTQTTIPLKMSTVALAEHLAEICAALTVRHWEYGSLGGRVLVAMLHRQTPTTFTECMMLLQDTLSVDFVACCQRHSDVLNDMVVHRRDYQYNIMGVRTLERSYLLKKNGIIVERPQYMLLRVAVALHGDDIEMVRETYEATSKLEYTHATPTLFHAGLAKQQLASCFLMTMTDDSIEGIFETLKRCALISKGAGGIGLSVSNIRGTGSRILGTNGVSNGLTPMLRVFNDTARYVDQCVLPTTIIYTTDGPKEIQSLVNHTDAVINTSGAEDIQNVLEHPYEGTMFNISTMHSIEPLVITPEHPIYLLKDLGQAYDLTETKKRIKNGQNVPNWTDAKEINVRDFIAYPIPTYNKDQPDITADDCYFYGVVLGNVQHDTSSITLHTTTKKNILEWLKNYFTNNCMNYTISVDDNTTNIRWNKCVHLPIKYGDVYDITKSKHVGSKWLHLPLAKAKYIVKGLMDIDGCSCKEIVFDSTSRHLIESMRYILLRMGVPTSGDISDRRASSHVTEVGRVLTNAPCYTLRLPNVTVVCDLLQVPEVGHCTTFIECDGFIYSRVTSISTSEYNGTLYDLQMSKEHVYITHNGMIHNGGGKRKGSFAIFLEPHHPDILDFLELKKNHGVDAEKARDLFYGLWISDLFMQRVKENKPWSVICPTQCPELQDAVGDHYAELYVKAEQEGHVIKTFDSSREVWFAIMDAQIETGTPYMMYKDHCNRKSNQQNLGTIRGSNLCCEIVEYTSAEETAVCTLASVSLTACVHDNHFDFEQLVRVTRLATRNLNKTIDVNWYPIEQAKNSNMKHRPIGVGVQGLADVFQLLDMPYDSDKARLLNKHIFETIYFGALSESVTLAKKHGAYSSFHGSPFSQGKTQIELWGQTTTDVRHNWSTLRQEMVETGTRNSLLTAPMPTASTAQILGNTESFEPRTSNLYTRRVLSGEYIVINKHLQNKLAQLGLWSDKMGRQLIEHRGSIQQIPGIPAHIKEIFRTVWEISQRSIIDMSADRGIYIDQSQSLNLHIEEPSRAVLTSVHFHAWSKGLKTGQYYLRTQPKTKAIQFTVATKRQKILLQEEEDCVMCSA
jgi:ribonucleoside-diphosphate reductase alpha subunit